MSLKAMEERGYPGPGWTEAGPESRRSGRWKRKNPYQDLR
jgi:hypothetical protein